MQRWSITRWYANRQGGQLVHGMQTDKVVKWSKYENQQTGHLVPW